jgi:3-phenylpropionate/cinnamic acid dioxygenase small subunit
VEVPAGADYFEDNYESLTTRIKKLRQPGAESQPRVQMRRLITNVIVCPRKRDEYDVLSYLLITCGSPDSSSCCVISAERYDLVRKAWLSFKIVRREIVTDRRQAAAVPIDLFL